MKHQDAPVQNITLKKCIFLNIYWSLHFIFLYFALKEDIHIVYQFIYYRIFWARLLRIKKVKQMFYSILMLFFQGLNDFSLTFELRVDHQYIVVITFWCLAVNCREAMHCICLFLIPTSSTSHIHRKQHPDRFPCEMFFLKVFNIRKINA
jgi:hypothetical protein